MVDDSYKIALEELVLELQIRKQKLDFRVNVAMGAVNYAQTFYLATMMERNMTDKFYNQVKAAYDQAVKKQNEVE